MREIVVKSKTSEDGKRRDCLVTERMELQGYVTRISRRCTYQVVREASLPSLQDCIRWSKNRLSPRYPRHVFVTKEVDATSGRENVTYKVLGHLYAILNCEIFNIGYRHVLSMKVTSREQE